MSLPAGCVERCREAIALLREGREQPGPRLIELTDSAEREVIAVRDELIQRLRAASDPAGQTALEQINVALSVLASVEYPGELDRKHVDTAVGQLEGLIRD